MAEKRKATLAWYSVRVLLAFTVRGERKPRMRTYEDRVILVRAKTHDDAKEKAGELVRNHEAPYKNVYGKTVQWKLQRVYQSVELFDRKLQDGTQVYWRFIRSSNPLKRLKREGTMNAAPCLEGC